MPEVPVVTWLEGGDADGAIIIASTDTVPDIVQGWQAHTWRNDTRSVAFLKVNIIQYLYTIYIQLYSNYSTTVDAYNITLNIILVGLCHRRTDDK